MISKIYTYILFFSFWKIFLLMNFQAKFSPWYAFLIACLYLQSLLPSHDGNEWEEGQPFPSQRGRECLRVSIQVLARQTCTRIVVDFIYEVSQQRIFQECVRLAVDLNEKFEWIDDSINHLLI